METLVQATAMDQTTPESVVAEEEAADSEEDEITFHPRARVSMGGADKKDAPAPTESPAAVARPMDEQALDSKDSEDEVTIDPHLSLGGSTEDAAASRRTSILPPPRSLPRQEDSPAPSNASEVPAALTEEPEPKIMEENDTASRTVHRTAQEEGEILVEAMSEETAPAVAAPAIPAEDPVPVVVEEPAAAAKPSKADPLAIIDWVAAQVSKLRLPSIVQDAIEAAEQGDVDGKVKSAQDKFAKLMENHTELTGKLFFLKQLSLDSSFGKAAESAALRSLAEAKSGLDAQLEADEFTKSAIHTIADDLECELARVMELREEYRSLVEHLETADSERKFRRRLKAEYEEAMGTEAELKARVGAAEDRIAAGRNAQREAVGEEARLVEERETLDAEAGAVRAYAGTLEWYEGLTGMLGGLGGLTIATGGVKEHAITFTVAAPLPEEPETSANCRHNVKVSFDRDHTAVRKIEAKSWSKHAVPHVDLANHAIQSNDWQGFLREYRFRCLNVALTEREAASFGETLAWVGVQNVVPQGFGHVFEAPGGGLGPGKQLMADLEYPQPHSLLHAVIGEGVFEERECTEEEAEQHGGSRVQAVLSAMEGSALCAEVA